jgi:secreted Zn-dependent insulinase-like peptidase
VYLPKSAEQNLVVETLPNGLKLGIIRSAATITPIISISVAAGHYHETYQSYGFSHLLEHMIFHRSKNFNSSELLEKHMNTHGGYINGWTHACHTNFHLSCHSEGFVQAVAMLWDKIVNPSFDQEDIKTEIAAIDEEYHLKHSDPVRGLFSVKKAIANPKHPFSRFTVGNQETLNEIPIEELQEQLLNHHNTYFHSGNVSVCIKIPIDAEHACENDKAQSFTNLIEQVKAILSCSIKQKAPNHRLTLAPLYEPNMSNTWVNVRVAHSHSQLVFCWLIKKQESALDVSALKMLRQLMESKHKQGLYDVLTYKKWASALSFTGGIEHSDHEELQLHVTLSALGKKHCEDVLALVKGYIAFLSRSQLANWRFSELEQQLSLLDQYGYKKDPIETAIECAQNLHNTSAENSSAALSLHQVKVRIADVISQMYKEIHHLIYIDEDSEVDKLTDFYNIPYSIKTVNKVDADTQQNFMLAPQNTYIPAQLLLVSPELKSDELKIIEKHGVLLKFAQIFKQEQPCGDCYISINSVAMCDTLSHIMSKKVWVEGLEKYLQRRFYQAHDAGISFRMYGHQHGLTLHTTGFSEKQLLLCIEIINCMITFRLNQDEFELGKQAIIKRLSNRLLQKPINQMFASLNTLVQGDTYSITQQVEEVKRLEFNALNAHQSQFFEKVFVEALMAGNWRLHAAQKMHQQLQSRLTSKGIWKKPPIYAKSIDEPCLPSLQNTLPGDASGNLNRQTALVLYQQIRYLVPSFVYVTEHATSISLILEHLLGPYMFLRLRNEKQMAYLVGVGYKPINMQAGIAIYLQSSKANAGQAYEAIQAVIGELLENWEQTKQEIKEAKTRVFEQCQPTDRDITSVARRLWGNFEFTEPFYQYKRLQSAIEYIDDDEIKLWLIKLSKANDGQILLSNDADALVRDELRKFTHHPHVI